MLQLFCKILIIFLIIYQHKTQAQHDHPYNDSHCNGHEADAHGVILMAEPTYRQTQLAANDDKKNPDTIPPSLQSIFTLDPRCQPGYILVGTRCRKKV